MSEENVALIHRWMDAWNNGDYDAVLSYMDPEIEVEIAMGSPVDGLYHGHTGLIQSMTEFWSEFASYQSVLRECIPAGDDLLLAVTHRGKGQGSGVEVELSHWQVATIRDGQLVRWRNFKTREQALAAAGLSE
jgi:ketosteroid isomerase-like protein